MMAFVITISDGALTLHSFPFVTTQVLAKAYPTYPVPAVEAPMWVLYLLG